LGDANQFSKAVAYVEPSGNAVEEEISGMRKDGRDPGTNGVTLNYRGLPNSNPFHIGNRIVRSWRQGSRDDAEVPSAPGLLRRERGDNAENQNNKAERS
jgi:hypothetical protein